MILQVGCYLVRPIVEKQFVFSCVGIITGDAQGGQKYLPPFYPVIVDLLLSLYKYYINDVSDIE